MPVAGSRKPAALRDSATPRLRDSATPKLRGYVRADLLGYFVPFGVATGLVLAVDQLAFDGDVVHAFLARDQQDVEGPTKFIEYFLGHAHGMRSVISGLAEENLDFHGADITSIRDLPKQRDLEQPI